MDEHSYFGGGWRKLNESFPMSSFERTKFRNSFFSSGDENKIEARKHRRQDRRGEPETACS